MNALDDWKDRFDAALKKAKSKRGKLDDVLMRVIADARADESLIELRKAFNELEKVAAEALT